MSKEEKAPKKRSPEEITYDLFDHILGRLGRPGQGTALLAELRGTPEAEPEETD